MAFDLPVLAYRAAGVPYALGGAGVLVSEKRYDLLAELIDLLVRDETWRRALLAGQRRRLEALSPARVEEQLATCVAQMTAP
jgi:glycosyltransferase involved in cell wall biosynthesis